MAKTHYEMLGLTRTATIEEIKTAYRQLAKKYHPDRFATAPEIQKQKAQAIFTQMTNAYVVLSNPEKKQKYDESQGFAVRPKTQQKTTTASTQQQQQTATAYTKETEIKKPVDGGNIHANITLTFDEACLGTNKPIKIKAMRECTVCDGKGYVMGGQFVVCPQCKGKKIVQKTTLFSQSNIVCPTCNGLGKVKMSACPKCGGKKAVETISIIKAKIPSGVTSGSKITFSGQGHVGENGGKTGDLILEVDVKKHKFFTIDGYNLVTDIPVSFIGACIGTTVTVPVLNGLDKITIPEGTKDGDIVKLKGEGIPGKILGGRGDLLARVVVEYPKNITPTQKKLLTDMDTLFTIDQYTKTESYMKMLSEYNESLKNKEE